MLYDILVAPIELIVDWVFLFSTNYMSIFGVLGAIVCVSVAINFLTLPIYNVADKIQNEEREAQKKFSPGIERIKAAFSGDERFMILQTFYRQNHYSPIYALRSSISVLIQIPFFMAAYHYLSNNELLKEGGFLFVKNLGEPDALFSAGGLALNALPIFMTLINVVSGIVYTKGFAVREKVQVYALAAVFLVLLYNSPSGLVLYWIMNNIFSLCKNFVKKTKNPARTILIFAAAFVALVMAASVYKNPLSFGWKKIAMLIILVILLAAPKYFAKIKGQPLFSLYAAHFALGALLVLYCLYKWDLHGWQISMKKIVFTAGTLVFASLPSILQKMPSLSATLEKIWAVLIPPPRIQIRPQFLSNKTKLISSCFFPAR